MVVLKVGPLMRYYIDGKPEIAVAGGTVREALEDAVAQFPALKFHIFDDKGMLRRHMNVFVNDTHIRQLKGVKTKLKENDRITLLASISGG